MINLSLRPAHDGLARDVASASRSVPSVSRQSFTNQLSAALDDTVSKPGTSHPSANPWMPDAARQTNASRQNSAPGSAAVSAPAPTGSRTAGTPLGMSGGAGVSDLGASHAATPSGLAGLIPSTPAAAAVAPPTAPSQHWYASDAADDAYWAKQPAPVQKLREIDDMQQRQQLASQLASQGYAIDVPIMVWGWDAGKVTALRQSFGYTWVPSAQQQPVSAAPGISAPGIVPYDPNHPPTGSILV